MSYEWDFGDGASASGVNVQHIFSSGNFTVKLTVTDNTGKKNTSVREINILPAEFPNLYLYLPFDKDCRDTSGKNLTVNSSDNILFETSSYGRSIRFNNTDSRSISVSHSNYLDGLDEITIAFFAKKDTIDKTATVINKHTIYGINLSVSGFAGSLSTNAGTKNFSVNNVVNDTDWHHYAITYDGANIVMYLDGKECSRVACSGKISRDASRAVIIGRNPWGDSFEGLMDEIRIYDRALSEDEIKQIMEGRTDDILIPSPTPGGPIPVDRVLESITLPSPVKGVPNGAAKTAAALGLPATVTMVTDGGLVQASVNWNVDLCTYDPANKKRQTFTVEGTVKMPPAVTNPNNISLTVSIQVTVDEAEAKPTPTASPDPTPTVKPSPMPTKSPSPTPSQASSDPSTPGSGGASTPLPTTKPEPTKVPIQDQTPKDDLISTEDLITTDYPEMVRLLELLYESADIRDNSLNPTYGIMMRREPVVTLTAGYQENLRGLVKLTFSDIRGDEWYAPYIPLAVYRKFVKGFPGGTFSGGNLVTRAEVLTMLARFNSSEKMIKQKAEQDVESFTRLAEQIGNDWYTHYVVAAKEGLVYPDLYTRQTILQPMTRGEVFFALANFLWNEDIQPGGKYYTLAESNETPAFNDTVKTIYMSNPDAGIDEPKCYCWYNQLVYAAENPENGVPMDFYPSIICLKDKGILLGNNGDSKWNDPITRAEVLALFERLARVWGEESNK